jgi:hypothetical protein
MLRMLMGLRMMMIVRMEIMLLRMLVWRAVDALVGSKASRGFLVVLLSAMSSSERGRELARPMLRAGRRIAKMAREGVKGLLRGRLMVCLRLRGMSVMGMVATVGRCMGSAGFLLVSMLRLSVDLG